MTKIRFNFPIIKLSAKKKGLIGLYFFFYGHDNLNG